MVHPLAARFVEVAGPYERGRPEYAAEVIDAIAAELRIPPGARSSPAHCLARGWMS
jgi:hypothetical protein